VVMEGRRAVLAQANAPPRARRPARCTRHCTVRSHAARTLLQRILNFVIVDPPFLMVTTLTFLASFLRAVCRNSLISLICLGILTLWGAQGGRRQRGRARAKEGRPKGRRARLATLAFRD
jgi:hypothetical protein